MVEASKVAGNSLSNLPDNVFSLKCVMIPICLIFMKNYEVPTSALIAFLLLYLFMI